MARIPAAQREQEQRATLVGLDALAYCCLACLGVVVLWMLPFFALDPTAAGNVLQTG